LGGTIDDSGHAIAVDSSGNAYVTGYTASTDFPTVNPLQATLHGVSNVFVTKLNAAGSALIYSTYLETHPESPPVTALSSFGGPNDRIEE
jgi:hypothetical protein